MQSYQILCQCVLSSADPKLHIS